MHLKAIAEDGYSDEQRSKQIRVLCTWLKEKMKILNKDFILALDWNNTIDLPLLNKLLKDSKLTILTQANEEGKNKEAISHIRGSKTLLEQIVISNDSKEEYVDKCVKITRSGEVIPRFAAKTSSEGNSDFDGIPFMSRFIYGKS
jgi:hypothetical protein